MKKEEGGRDGVGTHRHNQLQGLKVISQIEH